MWEARSCSILFPRTLVRLFLFEVRPHVGLWALKSAHRINGRGRDRISAENSLNEVLWEGDVNGTKGDRKGVKLGNRY
mgnify:CR=1 FL=1